VRGIVCNGCNIRLGRIDTGTRSRNPKPSKAWTPDYAASLAAYLASPPAQQMPRRTVQVRAEEPEPIPVHPAPGSPGRPRSLTDEQAAELRELRAQGVTVTDVARRLGISRRSVYRYQG
jgi:DNA-binding NarL/FixJ family response regulator